MGILGFGNGHLRNNPGNKSFSFRALIFCQKLILSPIILTFIGQFVTFAAATKGKISGSILSFGRKLGSGFDLVHLAPILNVVEIGLALNIKGECGT